MGRRAEEGEATSPSPDEAFAVLGDKTRLEILQALVEAEEPLEFSELRDRVGVRSNFSYHLGKLEEHFVEKTADGYDLRQTDRPAVSMPVGEYGVFQAIDEEPGFFDDPDLEPAEALVSHVTAALGHLGGEQDLRETSERLWAILENTKAIIYVKDLDGRYTLVNRQFERAVERDREEILGRTDRELLDEGTAEMLREHDRRAIAADGPVEFEEEVMWEGDRYTYLSVKVPLRDDSGEPVGVCGISTDITDLKRRERELEAKTERLEEFASVVAHDLRDPLNVARESLERVGEDVDDERLDRANEALDRAGAVVEDLLELARTGEQIGDVDPVDLGAVARDAWRDVSVDADLVVAADATVAADRDRLLGLFEHLFRNADDHADPGEIRVGLLGDAGADDPDGSPRGFYVEDDGSGIPPDERRVALRPGYSTAADGTGFGLAVVTDIAEAHGWSVTVAEGTAGGARLEFRGVDGG